MIIILVNTQQTDLKGAGHQIRYKCSVVFEKIAYTITKLKYDLII